VHVPLKPLEFIESGGEDVRIEVKRTDGVKAAIGPEYIRRGQVHRLFSRTDEAVILARHFWYTGRIGARAGGVARVEVVALFWYAGHVTDVLIFYEPAIEEELVTALPAK
jgi:hypothetical protein